MSRYKKHFYKLMVLAGFLVWIAETAYFGWNEEAQSKPERVLDTMSVFLILRTLMASY